MKAMTEKIAPRPTESETAASMRFTGGYYCAESVLLALAETNGQHTNGLSRIVSGMCGGVSRTGGMCGALLGGIAAFGLLFGRDHGSDDKEMVYTLTYHLSNQFTWNLAQPCAAVFLVAIFRHRKESSNSQKTNLAVPVALR